VNWLSNKQTGLAVYKGVGGSVIIQVRNIHLGCAQELQRVLIDAVGNVVHQTGDTGVDQHLGAVDAWEVSDITGASASRDAVQRSLDDRVGLRVDGSHTMPVDQQVPYFITVRLTRG